MLVQPGKIPRPTLRTQRLKYVRFLAIPFLYFSQFAPRLFVAGTLISALGLLLRAFAAGSIHKDQELARGGPYGFVRHPLYAGTFFVGLGFSVAGGRWWFLPVFVPLFLLLYQRTVAAESLELEERFGNEYRRYRSEVPAVVPRLRKGGVDRAKPAPRPGFRSWLYWRNKEWQAAIGVLVGYGMLWVRVSLFG